MVIDMGQSTVENISAVIAYVETHLDERLDLEKVAKGVHYSKYHLHRMFKDTVGVTLHDYIRRRQLTEAARLLVFSPKSILEIAQDAGYESQQAFTGIFKDMYKHPPLEYRGRGKYYPLQLAFTLNKNPAAPNEMATQITYAKLEDLPAWMDFASLVIDGFPCFDAQEHLKRLNYSIRQRQILVIRDKSIVVGGAAFSRAAGRIEFLGVHPQYRQYGIGEAFLDFIRDRIFTDLEISITTFREGDRADTGQRAAYRQLGFVESELLMECGYPVQRMILPKKRVLHTHFNLQVRTEREGSFDAAHRRRNGGYDE